MFGFFSTPGQRTGAWKRGLISATIQEPNPTIPERALTPYDEQDAITYMRLLDADAEGADRREAARIVLHIDPEREPDRARRAFESHLARAKWAARHGYRARLAA